MVVNILSVFKNRCCRKLRREECHEVYCSPNMMMTIKSSRIWARHAQERGYIHTRFHWETWKKGITKKTYLKME